jgi:predicted metalloprotease with PDZ domain
MSSSLKTRPSSPASTSTSSRWLPRSHRSTTSTSSPTSPKTPSCAPSPARRDLNNLVRETSAAYASRHYNVYHFLLTLSDVAGGEGLEHGQSSDNGVGEKGFADDSHQLAESDLLSHEFTHSWNGKYRRPCNSLSADFATMQQGKLLWVYEGMTQYLGNVLAARSGLKSQAQYRDMLATLRRQARLQARPRMALH